MLLVSYDISDDKLRTRFSKFLGKFGGRLQYSVFEIRNSERVLENISTQIACHFSKHFSQSDSVMIFDLSKQCKITRFGYAKNDETDLLIIWIANLRLHVKNGCKTVGNSPEYRQNDRKQGKKPSWFRKCDVFSEFISWRRVLNFYYCRFLYLYY